MAIAACSNCQSKRLFKTRKPVSAGGGEGPNVLPGLGTFWSAAKVDVVVCQDCGLMRYFAPREALEKLQKSPKWQRT
jgi:DNA-directed RNA polymerase subunit RPC12/RpoP